MMKKFITLVLIITTIISLFTTLTSCSQPSSYDGIKITCTSFPYYDICCEILGQRDGVTLLNNNGSDMHNYEPTLYDIKSISESNVFIYGGGSSEYWVENAIKASDNDDIIIIRLMDYVEVFTEDFKEGMQHTNHDHDHEHDDAHTSQEVHEIDEHIWLSLNNADKIAKVIYEKLSLLDYQNAEKYLNNYLTFSNEIDSLNTSYNQIFNDITTPLVFADRFPFRYFTEEYNIDYFAAFPGCSTESFASFSTIAFLIKTVKEYQVEYIITIDTNNSDFAKTIANETNCKIITLNSCQSINQEDIYNGVTYLSIMKNNFRILSEAFIQ